MCRCLVTHKCKCVRKNHSFKPINNRIYKRVADRSEGHLTSPRRGEPTNCQEMQLPTKSPGLWDNAYIIMPPPPFLIEKKKSL